MSSIGLAGFLSGGNIGGGGVSQESGTFNPTLNFSTPGDLSVSYAIQTGNFQRIGEMVFFRLLLTCTPTYTTAAGEAQFGGLPYACHADFANSIQPFGLETNITWLASATNLVANMIANQTYFLGRWFGSGIAATGMTIASWPSGSSRAIRVTGMYRRA